jgi:hypothetical protein
MMIVPLPIQLGYGTHEELKLQFTEHSIIFPISKMEIAPET